MKDVHFDLKPEDMNNEMDLTSPYGFKGDGKTYLQGYRKTLKEQLGPLKEKLSDEENLKEGTGTNPTSVTFSPAMVATKSMEKK